MVQGPRLKAQGKMILQNKTQFTFNIPYNNVCIWGDNSMPSKILVYEYFTGGGWIAPEIPHDLASEGLAMLRAVTEDFYKLRKATVIATLDKRLIDTPLTADSVAIVTPDKYKETISGLLKECDFALIIAPETDDLLAGLIKQAEDCGVKTLGCTPAAIRITSDKWECHKILSQAGLPVPETIVETGFKPVSTNRYNVREAALKIGFPLVIKPIDGVGCEGVNLVKDMITLRTILEDDDPIYTDRLLIQEYIKGEHLSASILSTGKDFIILSLNRQHISEGMPFKYSGGEIMPPPDKGDELHHITQKIIDAIPGLKGYFGIDLIRSNEGYKIIEINPRLTTSYTGLRKVINFNLAEAIYNSVINGRLPENVKLSGNYTFTKKMPE
jgi:tyramine---L-glutamate ligase